MKIRTKNVVFPLMILLVLAISSAEAAKWARDDSGNLVPVGGSKKAGAETSEAGAEKSAKDSKQSAAVARTRKQIQMLDDLYKTAVVLITEHYVNDPSTLSAATASKALFAAMKEKGWHEARLLGFTDVLFNPAENAPKDAFEETAKEKLLGGAAAYEEVAEIDGKDYLRMATSVPVVMEKCVMCHANFEGVEGAIGAISYTVPLVK